MFCLNRNRRNRGVSIVEYAVLIVALTAALVVVSSYLRRAVCAKWRSAADSIGNGRQYNPSGAKATQVQPF